jgi:PAS domain S-box-containing protein
MQYRYKLEGFDESWQYITQPMLSKVKYIGLKPGEYRLSVSAHNFSGAWSPVVKSEVIRIMPPYYLTWWFIFTCLMLTAGIIYGVIRINVQRSHNTKLEAEIDERKRVELALSQSRQKYLDLVELLPETVFESDLNGELVYLNDSGFRLFGYENQTIIHPLNLHRLVAASDLEQLNHHLLQVYTSGVPIKTVLGCIRNEGTTFPVSIHTAPILFNNNILGYRGIIIDLTEQKRFESQLQKNAEDLAALNSSKDKFFSIIAHDLRSPFTSFLGFTEMLDEEIDILPKEELQTIISSMRKSASNLYQLLENLLEWSLLHREITKFEPLHTYLKPLVEGCIEVMHESVKKKNLILQVDIGILLKVNADIHMLQTIIRNLVSNAIKFTPRGGKIKISAIAGPETFVTISVSDTGIGMSPEIAETIFKIDTNNKTKGTEGEPSTGLGLILCKEFVEKHGGKIWVESKENEGSIFYFTINSM